MNFILTGAAGFLGSHILLNWLSRHPTSKVLCLVRRTDQHSSRERIVHALARAVYESDAAVDPLDLIHRVETLEADLTDPAWRDTPEFRHWIAHSDGFEVIHSAANLSYLEENREQVLATNITGTENLFRAFAGMPGFQTFNYISTAYVAGSREGDIVEALADRPESFNNAYEESKWAAERVVRDLAVQHAIGYRIFRPSIIIGHSKTHRISSTTGFYNVIQSLVRLRKLYSSPQDVIAVPVPANRNAELNLIPVDFVVLEMLDVIASGTSSLDKIFHLTNERPISLADLFLGVAPLTGIRLAGSEVCENKPDSQISGLVNRGLRHYLPYFRYARNFSRQNVHANGAAHHQRSYWLDLTRMREFVKVFMSEDSQRAPQLARGADRTQASSHSRPPSSTELTQLDLAAQ